MRPERFHRISLLLSSKKHWSDACFRGRFQGRVWARHLTSKVCYVLIVQVSHISETPSNCGLSSGCERRLPFPSQQTSVHLSMWQNGALHIILVSYTCLFVCLVVATYPVNTLESRDYRDSSYSAVDIV